MRYNNTKAVNNCKEKRTRVLKFDEKEQATLVQKYKTEFLRTSAGMPCENTTLPISITTAKSATRAFAKMRTK